MNPEGRVPVLDLGRHRRVWLLSVDGRDAVKDGAAQVCHGLGTSYPTPFSAVFVNDGRLWLQVGEKRWDVADIVDVLQEADGARRAEYTLTLRDGTRETVTIKFPGSVAAARILDPTHDEIDSWEEDIMKMLPYTAADGWRSEGTGSVADWAARVTPVWTQGIRVPVEQQQKPGQG